MIPVIQLDPSTLSLWCDTTLIAAGPDGETLAEVVRKAVVGDDAVVGDIKALSDLSLATRAAHLVSCVWHEKRHFFDLMLSNYGAYRVREYFSLYLNMQVLAAECLHKKTPFVFPLDAASDPVRLDALQVNAVGENLKRQATNARDRKRQLANDRKPYKTSIGFVECGGEAQLEALAYFTQITAIQELFGTDLSKSVQNELQINDSDISRLDQKYRWILIVARGAGLIPKHSNGIEVVNTDLLSAILLAALCCRKHGQEGIWGANHAPFMPQSRLPGLLTVFENKGSEFRNASPTAIWHAVNQAARQLWGRTVTEEIDADYQEEGNYIQKYRRAGYHIPEGILASLEDYHRLRGDLIELLRKEPEQVVSLNSFVKRVLPRVDPIPIFAFPSGRTHELGEGDRGILGYSHAWPSGERYQWWWATSPVRERGNLQESLFSLEAHDHWLILVEQFAPLAKLMMNGYSHRIMLGPELVYAHAKLTNAGYKVVFDPLFSIPPEVRDKPFGDAGFYWNLTRLLEAHCDLCYATISHGGGYALSPWIFRSKENREIAIRLHGNGEKGESRWLADWSIWIVCEACRDLNFPSSS